MPVAIKEVGSGISATLARRLVDAGISIIDVAGGTNWAAVEAARMEDPQRAQLANAFSDWGIPTANAVFEVRSECPGATVIASGGIRSGIEIAKAIRTGAHLAGLLQPANESPEALIEHFETTIAELWIACFCTGLADLAALRTAELQRPI